VKEFNSLLKISSVKFKLRLPNERVKSIETVVESLDNFPKRCERPYTLVLDLDETLIHFKSDVNNPKFLIRPNAYSFLKNLSNSFEIFIFTAAQKEYADWILDKIDSRRVIAHRLYREHCQMSATSHLKDLGLLGRNLNKTIIVDNFPENFSLHKENGICIRSWYGDLSDQLLVVLEKYLLKMADDAPEDVRKHLKTHLDTKQEKGIFLIS
jgi:CTD small phosphatase-like protein 2